MRAQCCSTTYSRSSGYSMCSWPSPVSVCRLANGLCSTGQSKRPIRRPASLKIQRPTLRRPRPWARYRRSWMPKPTWDRTWAALPPRVWPKDSPYSPAAAWLAACLAARRTFPWTAVSWSSASRGCLRTCGHSPCISSPGASGNRSGSGPIGSESLSSTRRGCCCSTATVAASWRASFVWLVRTAWVWSSLPRTSRTCCRTPVAL